MFSHLQIRGSYWGRKKDSVGMGGGKIDSSLEVSKGAGERVGWTCIEWAISKVKAEAVREWGSEAAAAVMRQ